MTRRLVLLLGSAALLAFGGGCGDLANQLQADDVAIGALVRTPDLKNPETGETIPGVTTFQLFFGQVDKSKISASISGKQVASDGAFKGLSGAQVHLTFHDPANGDVDLKADDTGGGSYGLESGTAQRLTYVEGADYTATIDYSGQTFALHVTAPKASDIAEVAAAPNRVIAGHPAGADLTVTRSDAAGPDKNPVAFVNLSRATGQAKADAWNNAPKDPLGFLGLVLDDSAWKADSFTIPGSQFAPGSAYVVTLTALAKGNADPASGETALFVGSTLLAGVAAGGGVTTP